MLQLAISEYMYTFLRCTHMHLAVKYCLSEKAKCKFGKCSCSCRGAGGTIKQLFFKVWNLSDSLDPLFSLQSEKRTYNG